MRKQVLNSHLKYKLARITQMRDDGNQFISSHNRTTTGVLVLFNPRSIFPMLLHHMLEQLVRASKHFSWTVVPGLPTIADQTNDRTMLRISIIARTMSRDGPNIHHPPLL